MRRVRRILPRFLALVLCLSLVLPVPVSAADLYFTAVNDRLLPLSSDTMPLWSGGLLYVPYNVFSREVSGVDLDISTSYSRTAGTVTFYRTKQILVFDLNTGTSRDDITGATYYAKAIIRNGKPYVPLNMVCTFFGLARSYTAISQGYLVRIKNDQVVFSDSDFIEAAADLIDRRVRDYNQSLNPSPDTSTPPAQDPTPVSPPEEPVTSATDRHTYLAFRCTSKAYVEELLNALDDQAVFALFLFTPQALEESGVLVQRILGTGHSIGLLSEEGELSAVRADLEAGSRLLQLTAHTRTTVACAASSLHNALEKEGWVCWSETTVLEPSDTVGASTFAANTVNRLEGRTGSVYLTMDADANTVRVLSSLLRSCRNNHLILSTPLETRL